LLFISSNPPSVQAIDQQLRYKVPHNVAFILALRDAADIIPDLPRFGILPTHVGRMVKME
jgi:hypothetical protein